MWTKVNMAIVAMSVFLLCCLLQAAAQQAKEIVLENAGFTVTYSPILLLPVHCEWLLAADSMGKARRVPSWRFATDGRVPSPRATHSDYSGSGYDRGHMCPAADRSRTAAGMRSTFVMTNVCPQAPALNRGAWKKLEEGCRQLAKAGHVFKISADAVFWKADTQRIGRHHVAVPHGFVKTIRELHSDSIVYSRYFVNL